MTDAENVPPFSFYGGTRQSVASRPTEDTIHGLPRQFVRSMRTLFDMLDDRGTGQVELCEIERRWRDDAVPNLPGVLDALRVVAPPKGALTFDNFVSGLRLALHRSRSNKTALKSSSNITTPTEAGFRYGLPTHNSMNFSKVPNYQFSSLNNGSPPMPWGSVAPSVFTENLPRREPTFNRQNERPGRRFRHRRSNSGPICTAMVLPNVKTPSNVVGFVTRDDLKVEGGDRPFDQYTNGKKSEPTSRGEVPSYFSEEKTPNGPRESLKILPSEKLSSGLDNMTASTLFVDQTSPVMSVQPIVVSGKYIGITGTLKRTKSSTCLPQKKYGSLHRPGDSKNNVVSSSLNSLSTEQFSALNISDDSTKDAKAVEARKSTLDESPGITFRKRALRNRESVRNATLPVNPRRLDDGYGRRCNSASPPEVPVEKPSRSSTRIEVPSSRSSPVMADSPGSTGSSSINSSGTEEMTATMRRRRGNSASSAQRRRNARWNTAVVAFDSPTMKFLKELQQKEDMLKKGLESIDQIKKSFEMGIEKIKSDRDQLNAKVENYSYAIPKTSDLECLKHPEQMFGSSLSTAVGNLGNVLKEFQKLEESTKLEIKSSDSNKVTEQNLKLSQEVSEKSDQIAQLEKEKAALVRQLFQARSELQQSSGSQVNTSIFI